MYNAFQRICGFYIALIAAAYTASGDISVSVSADKTDIWKGKEVEFTASVTGQDGTVEYKWTLPDGATSPTDTDSTVKVTFNKEGEAQSCSVSVKDKCGQADDSKSVNVFTLSYNPNSIKVGVGGSEALIATVKPESLKSSVTFTSENDAVATVSGNAPNLSVGGVSVGSTSIVGELNQVKGAKVPVTAECKLVHKILKHICTAPLKYSNRYVESPVNLAKVWFVQAPCGYNYGKFQNVSVLKITIDYIDGSQSHCVSTGRLRDIYTQTEDNPPPSHVIEITSGGWVRVPNTQWEYFEHDDPPGFPLGRNEVTKISKYTEECEYKFYFLSKPAQAPESDWETALIGVWGYTNVLVRKELKDPSTGEVTGYDLEVDTANSTANPAFGDATGVAGTPGSELPLLTGQVAIPFMNFHWTVVTGGTNSYAVEFLRKR